MRKKSTSCWHFCFLYVAIVRLTCSFFNFKLSVLCGICCFPSSGGPIETQHISLPSSCSHLQHSEFRTLKQVRSWPAAAWENSQDKHSQIWAGCVLALEDRQSLKTAQLNLIFDTLHWGAKTQRVASRTTAIFSIYEKRTQKQQCK